MHQSIRYSIQAVNRTTTVTTPEPNPSPKMIQTSVRDIFHLGLVVLPERFKVKRIMTLHG